MSDEVERAGADLEWPSAETERHDYGELLADTPLRPKKRAFLAAYARLGVITAAAEAIGATRQIYYEWCEKDDAFVAAAGLAKAEANERLELLLLERARAGHDRVVETFDGKGRLVKREVSRGPSDTMLAMALNGNLPEKYKRRAEVTLNGPVVKAFAGFDPAEV